jgi:hypothetical protein
MPRNPRFPGRKVATIIHVSKYPTTNAQQIPREKAKMKTQPHSETLQVWPWQPI